MASRWEEKAAQLWCKPAHEKKVMDAEFAMSIAAALSEAYALGRKEAFDFVAEFQTARLRLKKDSEGCESVIKELVNQEMIWKARADEGGEGNHGR